MTGPSGVLADPKEWSAISALSSAGRSLLGRSDL